MKNDPKHMTDAELQAEIDLVREQKDRQTRREQLEYDVRRVRQAEERRGRSKPFFHLACSNCWKDGRDWCASWC